MRLWTHQTSDEVGYDDSVLRIHRFAIWRWAWIWGRQIKPPRDDGRQAHCGGEEVAYMRAHPEIWAETDDYSEIYAEHHYAPSDAQPRLWRS